MKNVDEEDLAEDSPIAKTVNLLVEYGIKSGASDIHIEPREGLWWCATALTVCYGGK